MSPNLAARWSPLAINKTSLQSHPEILQRSSHCLNIVHDKAYIFFGERSPRIPVAPEMVEFGLYDQSFRVLAPTSPWPAPRVGAASTVIGSDIYAWGGRGGKEMNPFSDGEEGPWKFDTGSRTWSKLESKGSRPEGRSYHTLTSDGVDTLYLHAGCPLTGRLATLHTYHIPSFTWTTLSSAPGPGRGGTVLASLPPGPEERTSTFIRYGGFAGYELGHDNEGGLDVYSAEKEKWLSADSNEGSLIVNGWHPPRRSVHGLVGIEENVGDTKESIRALLFSGESAPPPPELGHAGAGRFHSDVYALISESLAPLSFRWQAVPVDPSSPTPEPRGWFAATSWYDTKDNSWKALMVGGVTQQNDRLGDAWVLEIAQE